MQMWRMFIAGFLIGLSVAGWATSAQEKIDRSKTTSPCLAAGVDDEDIVRAIRTDKYGRVRCSPMPAGIPGR